MTYVRGVALSGMEYRPATLPGVANTDYLVPREQDFAYFSQQGLTLIRLALTWERLQPEIFGPLSAAYLAHVDRCIALAKQYGMQILIEPHNYGGRSINGVNYKVGTTEVPIAAFADFWRRMAERYVNDPGIYGYDLMNEPHTMPVGCTPATYHPDLSDVPPITNPSFADGTTGWSLDSDFTIGDGRVNQSSNTGWANLTSHNSAGGGIAVVPGATVTIQFDYSLTLTSGTAPRFRVSYNGAYGTEITGTGKTLPKTTGVVTHSVTFVVPDGVSMVWLRIQNQNGVATAYYTNFRLQTTNAPSRQVATTTLMNQAAIDAIRTVDQTHWIVLEFDRYTGLASFPDNFGSNPRVWWTDPVNRTMPSFHYYQDSDYSGSYANEWTPNLRERMPAQARRVFDWAAANNVRVFMGEYGVPSTADVSGAEYRKDLDAFMTLMDEYGIDGTYWAGGWGYTSPTTIHPTNNYTQHRRVLEVVQRHLAPSPAPEEPEETPSEVLAVGDVLRISFGAAYKKLLPHTNGLIYECKNHKAGDSLIAGLVKTDGVVTPISLALGSIALPYRNFASGKNGVSSTADIQIQAMELTEYWGGRGTRSPHSYRFSGLPAGEYRLRCGALVSATDGFVSNVHILTGTGPSGRFDANVGRASSQWTCTLEGIHPTADGELEVGFVADTDNQVAPVAIMILTRIA